MSDAPRPAARAWLYVLAAEGPEDLLKVGITRQPLARWEAFHPRWYEAFALHHSLLVACETRPDAQRLETTLHHALAGHRCPMPLSVRASAAGAREWYRGAWPLAREFVDACEARGHLVQRDVPAFLAPEMQARAQRLDALLREAHGRLLDGWLSPAQRRALVDLVDGHCRFDALLADALPQPAWDDLRRAGG